MSHLEALGAVLLALCALPYTWHVLKGGAAGSLLFLAMWTAGELALLVSVDISAHPYLALNYWVNSVCLMGCWIRLGFSEIRRPNSPDSPL